MYYAPSHVFAAKTSFKSDHGRQAENRDLLINHLFLFLETEHFDHAHAQADTRCERMPSMMPLSFEVKCTGSIT